MSSGPRVRAASVSTLSVVARSMPLASATATRAGVRAAVITVHVRGGDLTGGVGGGQRGQVGQPPPGADQAGGVAAGDPAVPGQPGLHRRHAVGLLHLPRSPAATPRVCSAGSPLRVVCSTGRPSSSSLVGQVGGIEGGQVEAASWSSSDRSYDTADTSSPPESNV